MLILFLILKDVASLPYRYRNYSQVHALIQQYHSLGYLAPLPLDSASQLVYWVGAFKPQLPILLLIGSFHGDQVSGTNGILQFVKIYNQKKLKFISSRVNYLIFPIANPSGYNGRMREQTVQGKLLDPNRDFPYDRESINQSCCYSTACRVLSELYSKLSIEGTLTFHGGDWSISYPPGNFAHQKQSSPDQQFYKTVAQDLKNSSDQRYRVGTMNDVVYPLHGAFEDWAYYSGWDKKFESQCFKDKTKYSPSMQGFVFLIQNGQKFPNDSQYGDSDYFIQRNQIYSGYVTRTVLLIQTVSFWFDPLVQIWSDGEEVRLRVRGCESAGGVVKVLRGGVELQENVSLKLNQIKKIKGKSAGVFLNCSNNFPLTNLKLIERIRNSSITRLVSHPLFVPLESLQTNHLILIELLFLALLLLVLAFIFWRQRRSRQPQQLKQIPTTDANL